MTALSDLIARLEAAKEGSEEISREIAEAIGWRQEYVGDDSRGYFVPRYAVWFDPSNARKEAGQLYPPFSQSLDAALTLVPADRNTILKIYEPGEHVAFCLPKDGGRSETWTKAATPALALCIAALKAREAAR